MLRFSDKLLEEDIFYFFQCMVKKIGYFCSVKTKRIKCNIFINHGRNTLTSIVLVSLATLVIAGLYYMFPPPWQIQDWEGRKCREIAYGECVCVCV